MTGERGTHDRRTAWADPWLLTILLLTAAILLLWGHFKPLDQDEVFVLQTDSVSSVRTLVDVQRHTPISLDPLFYHLLGHGSISVFGANAFAVRLPSLLGYLLLQVCLYLIGRTLAGPHAGVVAAAVPAFTATLFYGVEARPYGVLLGLAALVLLCWQRAVCLQGRRRSGTLLTLAAALALALNTHYFAVLLLIPLYAAEAFRSVVKSRDEKRFRFDWPVVASIFLGSAGVVFALPLQKAAGEFRLHYYNAGGVGLHAITQSYRALIVNYTTYSAGVQRAWTVALLLFALLLLWGLWRSRRNRLAAPAAVWVYLLLLAALPFAGFLLARFVTHSIEVRYVLPAIIGIAVLVALAAEPLLRSPRGFLAAIITSLLLIAATGAVRVSEEHRRRDAVLASLSVSQPLRARLLASPEARIYVQNLGFFEEITQVLPDSLRSRMVLLYSRDEELRWLQHDTAALTAMHLRHFTHVPTARYEDLQRQPGEHLLLLHPDGWEWVEKALAQDGAHVLPVEAALGGDMVGVRFTGTGGTHHER